MTPWLLSSAFFSLTFNDGNSKCVAKRLKEISLCDVPPVLWAISIRPLCHRSPKLGTRAEVEKIRRKRLWVFQQSTEEAVPGSFSQFQSTKGILNHIGLCRFQELKQFVNSPRENKERRCNGSSNIHRVFTLTWVHWPQQPHRVLPFGWIKTKQSSWNLECLPWGGARDGRQICSILLLMNIYELGPRLTDAAAFHANFTKTQAFFHFLLGDRNNYCKVASQQSFASSFQHTKRVPTTKAKISEAEKQSGPCQLKLLDCWVRLLSIICEDCTPKATHPDHLVFMRKSR